MASSTQSENSLASQDHSILRKRKQIYQPASITTSTPSTSLDPLLPLSASAEPQHDQYTMAPPIGIGLKKAIVQPGMFHNPPFSIEVPGVGPVDGETIPRRNAKYVDSLLSRPKPEVATLYNVLQYARDAFGSAPALGSRALIQTHEEIKPTKEKVGDEERMVNKKWSFYEMEKYEWTNYEDYFELAMKIGQGFRKMGLQRGDRVHIYANTSMRWLAMSHGATTQSLPIVTSYATLGEAGLETSLVQTRAKAIFVDSDLILKLQSVLHKASGVGLVVYNDDRSFKDEDVRKLQAAHPKLTIMSFSSLVDLGRENPLAADPPTPDDLCCIMYTSGTTGTPKGVPLKHKNVVAAVAGLDSIFKDYVGPQDSVLSYLPLAHSFEYAFENTCLFWGMKMGYGNARTMLDKSMKNCKGDIKELQPTIMVGVPAVWDLVKKGIQETVSKKSRFSQWIFSSALKLKTWMCHVKCPGVGLLDKIVFNTVKKQFGGRLRACFNGAGPLSKEDRSFISHTVAPLISGYGLTETCAMGALQDPLEWTNDTLGDIPACIEIKLVDYPEANYFAKNNQGEIWIRGNAVMDAYYDNAEETQAAITPDGWFRTGDIGGWAGNGHLQLLDRKKNLIKTSAGEYIAMEKLESIYRGSSVVSNVCIYAKGEKRNILAIVVPRKDALMQYYQDMDPASSRYYLEKSFSQLVRESKTKSWILENLKHEARKGKLIGAEVISAVIVTDEEWTNENGLLTPAQKLQRRKIWPLFQKEIDEAYKQPNIH